MVLDEAVDTASETEDEDDAGDADGDAKTGEKRTSAIPTERIKSQFVMGVKQDWHYFFPFFLDFLDFLAGFLGDFLGISDFSGFSALVDFSDFSDFSAMEFLTIWTETGWGRSASSTVLISVSIWPSSMRMTRVA